MKQNINYLVEAANRYMPKLQEAEFSMVKDKTTHYDAYDKNKEREDIPEHRQDYIPKFKQFVANDSDLTKWYKDRGYKNMRLSAIRQLKSLDDVDPGRNIYFITDSEGAITHIISQSVVDNERKELVIKTYTVETGEINTIPDDEKGYKHLKDVSKRIAEKNGGKIERLHIEEAPTEEEDSDMSKKINLLKGTPEDTKRVIIKGPNSVFDHRDIIYHIKDIKKRQPNISEKELIDAVLAEYTPKVKSTPNDMFVLNNNLLYKNDDGTFNVLKDGNIQKNIPLVNILSALANNRNSSLHRFTFK